MSGMLSSHKGENHSKCLKTDTFMGKDSNMPGVMVPTPLCQSECSYAGNQPIANSEAFLSFCKAVLEVGKEVSEPATTHWHLVHAQTKQ